MGREYEITIQAYKYYDFDNEKWSHKRKQVIKCSRLEINKILDENFKLSSGNDININIKAI